jgi:hypothetical protein
VKVLEGSEIYNFGIITLGHFSSNFQSYSRSNSASRNEITPERVVASRRAIRTLRRARDRRSKHRTSPDAPPCHAELPHAPTPQRSPVCPLCARLLMSRPYRSLMAEAPSRRSNAPAHCSPPINSATLSPRACKPRPSVPAPPPRRHWSTVAELRSPRSSVAGRPPQHLPHLTLDP